MNVDRISTRIYVCSALTRVHRETYVSSDPAGTQLGPKRYGAELIEFSSETAFRPREAQLDDADLRIIDTLVRDGRTNARSMVDVAGLTEETVAARIRSMIERNIIGITAIFDWHAAGYHWEVWLAVECEAGSIRPVMKALAELDEVISVYTVFGPVDLVVQVLCTDRVALLAFLSGTLTQVTGVRQADVMVSLDTAKYFHQFAWVPVEPRPLQFPNPVVELSDLDLAIIDSVVRNGRTSNREIGRELGVADGTIRAHIRRLEGAGVLRICAQVHPARSGMISARAFVGISVQGADTTSIAVELAHIAEIVTISITAGRYELWCYVLAQNRRRLVEIVSEHIRPLKGVHTSETWEVIDSEKHVSHWARW